MSIAAMSAVWESADCSQTSLLVLLALADHANDAGECWPAYPRIAQRARTSERHVRRIMRELEEQGLIRRDRRPGHETHYYVALPEGGHRRPGTPKSPGTYRSAKGGHGGPKGGTPMSHEPSEPPIEPSSSAATAAPTAQTLVAEWIDHSKAKPPSRVVGQMAKEIKGLLDEGYAYADVRGAVADWSTRGLAPSLLPSILNDRLNGGPSQTRRGGRLTPTERAQQTLAIGAAMAAAQNPRLEIAR